MASSNASILTRNSLLSLPISQLHTRTRIQPNPPHTTRPGLSSSSSSISSSSTNNGLKSLYLSYIGSRRFSSGNNFQMTSAVSGDGGGGGYGGNSDDGDSGGGNSGGGDGEGGSSNWSLLAWYLSLLEKYPVWTKAVTSALLTLCGDLICQLWIDQVASVDVKRTFLFTFLGLVLVGPTLHFWYLYLSKLVTTPGLSGTLMRLVIDQFLFAPIFVGVFLSSLVTLEGRSSQVIPKLQQEWFSSVLANWQLWIPFQFINFRFVPQQFQVLAANFIALVWNVILSYKAHKEVIVK
ncbi:protein sym-1-like [Lycium ferocissimum]|uniref:protein sym-1-like n=1 Tax=Lycium ferocissimum TaxID=112874 RepID=UPI00281591FE|nr:protein sym-1-like [Lycium ferocissimum]XP_059304504.1 protein sym-1-like [Lycium ferocissimum]XP_059304505.1 protein sym-1-like [Lycium ferocissimum]XP_059304506.1 protein sym-1-like [Lycium ferocissimum]XP_059304507.1 protein sym-1-like [Lycium ferocissimum]